MLRIGAADDDVVAGAPGQRHHRVLQAEAQPTRIGQRVPPPGVCSTPARITWPSITIAARVPSRDSCSSAIGPGEARRHRGGVDGYAGRLAGCAPG